MTRAGAALAALVLSVSRLGLAQSSEPWLLRWFVFPGYNSLEGLSGNVLLAFRKPPPVGPIPSSAGVELTARLSASGTRGAQFALDFPGRWPGWRFLAIAGAERWRRAPYYGRGNDTQYSDSLEAANGPVHYYRYALYRTTGALTVQRRLAGRLRVLAGAQWRHYHAQPLQSVQTFLGDEVAGGLNADTGSTSGLEFRGGLLLDTRDEEASPASGLFLEALVARSVASLGDFAYTRYAIGAREFVPLGEFTSLGLRQSVELADRPLPFYVAFERLTSWRPEDGFGGPTTLRANRPGRWIAPNKAVASIDLRYKKYDIPLPRSPVRLWLLLFADVGRVWLEDESFSLDGLHGDAGAGFRLQFSKGSLFGMDFGWSPDAGFEFATAFTFAY